MSEPAAERSAGAAAHESFEAELRSRFAGEEAEAVIAFARALFARAGAAYAVELADEDRLVLVVSAFRFFARSSAPARCRIWTPSRAEDGWDSPYTILESHLTDRPFIVDTIREFLHKQRIAVRHLIHPIYSVERDGEGALRRMRSLDSAAQRESFVHAALEKVPEADHSRLEAALQERLDDLVAATDDYPRMRERLEEVGRELDRLRRVIPERETEIAEARDFLRWLGTGNFVFLGYRSYRFGRDSERPGFQPEAGSELGLLKRKSAAGATPAPEELPSAAESGGPLLIVGPSSAESTVHRAVRMDAIEIKRLTEKAEPAGLHLFLGLFTGKAYTEESAEVPVLRQKLREILAAEQVLPDSHDYKAVVSIFDTIPKSELFALPVSALRADVRAILSVEGTDTVRVHLWPAAGGRGLTVMVILHRDRFSGEVRRRIQELLEERFASPVVDTQLALGEGEQARLHFYLAGAVTAKVRAEDLEKEIAEIVKSWDDRLRERLLAEHPGATGRALAAGYTELFTPEYKASTDVAEALADIRTIERLARPAGTEVELADAVGDDAGRFTILKLFLRGESIVLSDFLPLLENLGLRVFAEDSVPLGEAEERVFLYRFRVQDRRGQPLDVGRVKPLVAPAILEMRAGRADNDSLNRLIVDAGLAWREVDLLRTYRNLAVQTGGGPSRPALNEVLIKHAQSARALYELFAARFQPELADRERRVDEARQRFLKTLDAVETSAEDRMLRNYQALIDGTLRASFYSPPRPEHPFLAIKVHSQAIAFFPRPRPLYEIYVHSARVEGLHLRGGKIARGGIRFSDRPDDFRAEILGLMKTQMVKNAVIVPVGSKGGFVVKRPKPGDEGAQEVRECYATLTRGLLDLTDNIVRGEIAPPSAVVRYDDDDPYLVVAADKGTAGFSDLANQVAAECGFWLGDAFASGGSQGYDHKKEGITARGAWECIRRHFRELGRNIQNEPFTVAGIGDMSGDVFGNGMLLSKQIRLRAAFNHLHVFLDPNPDPAASFRERERLFKLPRSSWADYDRKLLSQGATIVARGAKAATLSPEVRALLGIEATELDGDGLVRAVLAMETDLLFNGGVGTYVRASQETDAEVGDHGNDAVRRTAGEIRALVVGEGGNLGFTQRARIEYALRGGRINTDAIDNSGGVDLSDHEVNLKILFQPLLESKEMSPAQRNRLLEQVKPEVIEHVLSHNARQSLLLSLDQLRSATRLVEFRDQMTDLEQEGSLDRALEGLPDRETLRLRRSSFRGFTRPELAVLAAYSKLRLQRQLLASPWVDDPVFEQYLVAYFPRIVAERFAKAMRAHRLRREIIATDLGNQVIDRMGAAFTQRMLRDTAADAPSSVAAWVLVMDLTEADRLFDQVAAADVRADDAYALCLRWEQAVESACKLLIGMLRRTGPLAERISGWRRSLSELADLAERERGSEAPAEENRLESLGLSPGIARSLVALGSLRTGLEIIRIAEDCQCPLTDAAEVHRRVATLVDFASLEQWFDAVPGDDRWEKRAAEGLREDLAAARRRMAAAILERSEPDIAARSAAFVAAHEGELTRLRALIEDLLAGRKLSIAGMVVIARELWKVAGS